jgi:hypothetical protein
MVWVQEGGRAVEVVLRMVIGAGCGQGVWSLGASNKAAIEGRS